MIPDFVTSHPFGLLDYNVGNSLCRTKHTIAFDKRNNLKSKFITSEKR